MSAMLKIETPKSCMGCHLKYDDRYDQPFCIGIRSTVGAYGDSRHPDCPLKITPETPEGELKPCPFCGGEAKADYCDLVTHGSTSIHWHVYCKSCRIKTERFTESDSYQRAIAAWNRRDGNA